MATRLVFSSARISCRSFIQRTSRTIVNPFKPNYRNYGRRNFATFEASEAAGSNIWKWLSIGTVGISASLALTWTTKRIRAESEEFRDKREPFLPAEKIIVDGREWYRGYASTESNDFREVAYFPHGQQLSSFREMILAVFLRGQTANDILNQLEKTTTVLEKNEKELLFTGNSEENDQKVCLVARVNPDPNNKNNCYLVSYLRQGKPEEVVNFDENATKKWSTSLKGLVFDF